MSTVVTQTAPVRTTNLAYVDALRGVAILGVIAVHSLLVVGTTAHLPETFVTMISNAAWGVRLFFIASAFTLMRSWHLRRDEQRPTLNFYLRRWFRIAPAYYAGMLGYSAWQYLQTGTRPALSKAALEALFLHGTSPSGMNSIVPGGWSITVEMCFYLFVPLLATYITTLTRAVWALLGAILLHATFSWTLRHYPLHEDVNTWNLYLAWFLPKQLPVFAFGFVFYFLSKLRPVVAPAALLAASLLLIATYLAKPSLAVGPPSFDLLPEDLGMLLGLMLLCLALSYQPYRFFVNRFTRTIGNLSYGLYLVHFGVLFILKERGWQDVIQPTSTSRAFINYGARYALVLAISYCLAWLLHKLIEKPAQDFGKKVITRLERRTAVAGK